jgi:ribosomal protein S12 methylthiotransferase accessory factor YcaO
MKAGLSSADTAAKASAFGGNAWCPSGELAGRAGLDWALPLPCRSAPGYVFLAGSVAGVSVGGGGATQQEALARCAGEAAEVRAQLQLPELSDLPPDPRIDAVWCGTDTGPRIAARNLTTGRAVGVPAAAVHLDPAIAAFLRPDAPPRSLGLAAGSEQEAAIGSGLLELVERDAAARWWFDGEAARLPDAVEAGCAGEWLRRMRDRAPEPRRSTQFLLLPALLPVACALSFDADGAGLAAGFKAAEDVVTALRGAVVELLQMEIALDMARHRGALGTATSGDRAHLARARVRQDDYLAFRPLPPAPRAETGSDVVVRVQGAGHEVTVAELGTSLEGITVVKVFVPTLRTLLGEKPTRPDVPGAAAELM